MTDGGDDLRGKRRKPSRRRVFPAIAVATAALFAVGWSVAWRILEMSVQSGLEIWLDDEKANGRNWECADQSIDGFPFRIAIRCRSAAVTARVNGRDIHADAGSLVVHMDAVAPRTIVAELAGPLHLTSAGVRLAATATWDSARADITSPGGAEPKFAVAFTGAVVELSVGDAPATKLSAQRLLASVRPQGQPQGQPLDVDVDASLERLQATHLDDFTGERAPADVRVAGRLKNFTQIVPGNLPQSLEIWRRANGVLDVERAQFSKGSLNVAASGKLALDAAHRVVGEVEVEASGVAPLLPKFGLSPGAIAIANMMDSAASSAAKPMRLPVNLKNGRLSIGVIPTPFVLTPLY